MPKSTVKQPQDHQKKAAKRLRDEATKTDPMGELLGRVITIEGRVGSVDVTVLEDPMEWDAKADEILAGWSEVGAIVIGEMIPFLRCIISVEDGRALEQVRPSRRAVEDLVDMLTDVNEDGDSLGDELGESAAS